MKTKVVKKIPNSLVKKTTRSAIKMRPNSKTTSTVKMKTLLCKATS